MPIDPRIARNSRAVFAMAGHFHAKGATVDDAEHMKPLSNPPRAAHLDRSEVIIINGKRVAVKALDNNFQDENDWPWRQQFYVCGQEDHERNPCSLYVQVSADCRHAAIVTGSTRTKWFPVERSPTGGDSREGFQVCPLEHVKFIKIEGGCSDQ